MNNGPARAVRLIGPSGERIDLPESLVRVLRQVVHALAQDRVVSVVPMHKQLTTQQAADLLNVSRPYLIQLLERGDIPYSKTGTHRRIRLDDLVRYKARRDAEIDRILDDLAQMHRDLGLY